MKRETATGAPHPDRLNNERTENSEVNVRSTDHSEGQAVKENESSGQTEGGVGDTQTAEAESVAAGVLNIANVEK